jgi:hypothetical protein
LQVLTTFIAVEMFTTLIMKLYLPRAYKTDKPVFIFLILFLFAQLFIAFKRGMEVAPFFNYGMFSEKVKPRPVYPVLELYSGGERIEAAGYSLHTWDRLLGTYDFITDTGYNTQLYENEVKRIMKKAGWHPAKKNYVMAAEEPYLKERWKLFAENLLNRKIDSFRINNYFWNGKQLLPEQY